jgi:hypothetical protein
MDALQQPRPRSAKILAFDRFMRTTSRKKSQPAPPPPPAAPQTWWQRSRETVNVVSAIFLGLTTLVSVWLAIDWHNVANQSISSDEHVNLLIDDKLKPLSLQIQTLTAQVNDALGQLKRIDARVNTLKPDGTNLQVKGRSPGEVLTGIRANLAKAEKRRQQLPVAELVDYKKKVQSIGPSSMDYWTTVAAIINYQSFLNQLQHNAPDPDSVAKPCMFATESPNVRHNVLSGTQHFTNCYVDLDTSSNLIQDAVIKDSVVRYHGGKITFQHAVFINCRFVVDIKGSQEPNRPDLLLALMRSDQINFQLPAAG